MLDGTLPFAPRRVARVLVADADAATRNALCALLAEDARVSVAVEAADGCAAAGGILSFRPELAILGGFRDRRASDVVALTADAHLPYYLFLPSTDELERHLLEEHALDVLQRLSNGTHLRSAVRRAMHEGQPKERMRRAERLRLLLEDWETPREPEDHAKLPRVSRPIQASRHPAPYAARLTAYDGAHLVLLRVADIEWAESNGSRLRLHTAHGPRESHMTMAELERRLDPATFLRVSRSSIVNRSAIRAVSDEFEADPHVYLSSGVTLPMNRQYRAKWSG